MAVEAKKVLAQIELKFKGKSLSKDFKKNLAEKLALKIDNDTDIEGYIDDREDIILETSAEGDRRATTATNNAKSDAVKKLTDVVEKAPADEDDESLKDAPAWAKALIKQNKALETKMQEMEAAKSVQTISERFKNDERLKGIDAKLLKGRFPTKDEDFEAAVLEAVEDLGGYKTTENSGEGSKTIQTNIGKGFNDKPSFATGVKTQVAEKATVAVPAEITAFTAGINKQNNSQVKTT